MAKMELITLNNGKALLKPETASAIAEYERTMRILKAKEDALKEAILAEMEAKNIVKIDTDELTITYIAPTERETFDAKSFRKDCPDVYDDYVKFASVKSSIRIKVK